SDTVPNYQAAMGLLYILAYDNSIRNSPPANNAVYGRVMYHLIKHCNDTFGVTYFEHWNEPDQQWLNPIMVKFFWRGDEYQLYDAYAAIATEVSADADLASQVKLGGCSFALYSIGNLIPIRFLQEVQTNSTKFDFLSFHPYSDTQLKGGYDSAKVALVEGWRSQYVPNAELINAEWGRLDVTTDTWGSLDYGLNKVEHIIDMLDRNVSMSFEVALFDQETTTDNYTYLGMYRVGPIVPKPSAYVFYNLNRMNDVPNRLQLTINDGMYGLAGMNDAQNKVVIVIPAPDPGQGSNALELNVSNLPWGANSFQADRYELTDGTYQQGLFSELTMSVTSSGGSFMDTLSYSSVNGNGRLVIWELTSGPLSVGEEEAVPFGFSVQPNPAFDRITLQFRGPVPPKYCVSIVNAVGAEMYAEEVLSSDPQHAIHSDLGNGLYIVRVVSDGKVFTRKVVIER
ncbi:MAG: T9SS type A sorting domain-containing protein, partial [Flavobacteriales bacterium]